MDKTLLTAKQDLATFSKGNLEKMFDHFHIQGDDYNDRLWKLTITIFNNTAWQKGMQPSGMDVTQDSDVKNLVLNMDSKQSYRFLCLIILDMLHDSKAERSSKGTQASLDGMSLGWLLAAMFNDLYLNIDEAEKYTKFIQFFTMIVKTFKNILGEKFENIISDKEPDTVIYTTNNYQEIYDYLCKQTNSIKLKAAKSFEQDVFDAIWNNYMNNANVTEAYFEPPKKGQDPSDTLNLVNNFIVAENLDRESCIDMLTNGYPRVFFEKYGYKTGLPSIADPGYNMLPGIRNKSDFDSSSQNYTIKLQLDGDIIPCNINYEYRDDTTYSFISLPNSTSIVKSAQVKDVGTKGDANISISATEMRTYVYDLESSMNYALKNYSRSWQAIMNSIKEQYSKVLVELYNKKKDWDIFVENKLFTIQRAQMRPRRAAAKRAEQRLKQEQPEIEDLIQAGTSQKRSKRQRSSSQSPPTKKRAAVIPKFTNKVRKQYMFLDYKNEDINKKNPSSLGAFTTRINNYINEINGTGSSLPTEQLLKIYTLLKGININAITPEIYTRITELEKLLDINSGDQSINKKLQVILDKVVRYSYNDSNKQIEQSGECRNSPYKSIYEHFWGVYSQDYVSTLEEQYWEDVYKLKQLLPNTSPEMQKQLCLDFFEKWYEYGTDDSILNRLEGVSEEIDALQQHLQDLDLREKAISRLGDTWTTYKNYIEGHPNLAIEDILETINQTLEENADRVRRMTYLRSIFEGYEGVLAKNALEAITEPKDNITEQIKLLEDIKNNGDILNILLPLQEGLLIILTKSSEQNTENYVQILKDYKQYVKYTIDNNLINPEILKANNGSLLEIVDYIINTPNNTNNNKIITALNEINANLSVQIQQLKENIHNLFNNYGITTSITQKFGAFIKDTPIITEKEQIYTEESAEEFGRAFAEKCNELPETCDDLEYFEKMEAEILSLQIKEWTDEANNIQAKISNYDSGIDLDKLQQNLNELQQLIDYGKLNPLIRKHIERSKQKAVNNPSNCSIRDLCYTFQSPYWRKYYNYLWRNQDNIVWLVSEYINSIENVGNLEQYLQKKYAFTWQKMFAKTMGDMGQMLYCITNGYNFITQDRMAAAIGFYLISVTANDYSKPWSVIYSRNVDDRLYIATNYQSVRPTILEQPIQRQLARERSEGQSFRERYPQRVVQRPLVDMSDDEL